jgi:hypothetical protein
MEHRMSIWLVIPLVAGIIGVLVAVFKGRTSGGTGLHIDH